MKILLAMGAMAAVVLASGCGGDAKSGESAAKSGSGIPKVIRVGSETTFPPFEFTKDDKYVGFDLDLADAVIKQMGSQMEFKSMGFDALIPAVQSGQIDLIAAGLDATPERESRSLSPTPISHRMATSSLSEKTMMISRTGQIWKARMSARRSAPSR